MKTLLLLLGFFSFSSLCLAQQKAVYDYDMAGNRITRALITMTSSQRASNDQEENETISNSLLTCQVAVYPNPTAGELNLTISNGEENAVSNIRIYDSSGKLLKELEAQGNTSVSIDLSPYLAGYYLIDFNQGESKSFYKIIKQ